MGAVTPASSDPPHSSACFHVSSPGPLRAACSIRRPNASTHPASLGAGPPLALMPRGGRPLLDCRAIRSFPSLLPPLPLHGRFLLRMEPRAPVPIRGRAVPPPHMSTALSLPGPCATEFRRIEVALFSSLLPFLFLLVQCQCLAGILISGSRCKPFESHERL